jgi:hypothetical protein
MEQKPKMRYDDKELSLIKATFADNEPMLFTLRKVFLQAELSEVELKQLENISKSPQALALLRKAYAPVIEFEAPFGQVVDLWMTVDTKELNPEQARLALMVRSQLDAGLEAGLARLASPEAKGTNPLKEYKPDFDLSDEELYVGYVSRNALISNTEQRLQELSFLAGRKEETVEETITRLHQNSSK